MKIINEPKVYLVGQSRILDRGVKGFLTDHETGWEVPLDLNEGHVGDGELLCELAARISPFSFGENQDTKGTRKFVRSIVKRQHGSCLENATWSFIVTRVSRSLSHELVRSRIGMSYLQRSQRYVNESEANFIEPDIIAKDPELHQLWCASIEASHQAYTLLVEKLSEKVKQDQFADLSLFERKKLARQSARSVLPNACETMVFVTLNARSARNFLELRASRHADVEIRKLSNRLYEILVQEAPSIFGDYEKVDLGDGTFELKTNYCRI